MNPVRLFATVCLLVIAIITTLYKPAFAATATLTYDINIVRDEQGVILDKSVMETLHVVMTDPLSYWTRATYRCDGPEGAREHFWDDGAIYPSQDEDGSWRYTDPLVFRYLNFGSNYDLWGIAGGSTIVYTYNPPNMVANPWDASTSTTTITW